MSRRLVIGLLSSALALTLVVPGAAMAKDKDKGVCKQGAWATLVAVDGQRFASKRACTEYVAQGGGGFLLAIAYSNLDGEPGYQPGGSDKLIAKLVDNDMNRLDEGDAVVFENALLSFDPRFGPFLEPRLTVEAGVVSPGRTAVARVPEGYVSFGTARDLGGSDVFEGSWFDEWYEEHELLYVDGGRIDTITSDHDAPGRPPSVPYLERSQDPPSLDDFLEVEVY